MTTPFTKSDVDEFRNLIESNEGWKQIINKPELQLYSQSVEKGMKFKYSTSILKNITPLEFYEMQNDLAFQKTLSDNVLLSEVVTQIDSCQAIVHRVMKLPLFDPRDMVIQVLNYRNKDDSEVILMFKSVESDVQPVKGSVRAIVYYQGFRMKRTEEGSVFTMYSHCDMGGNMSGMNGDTQLKMMAKGMPKKMKENMEKFKKWNEKNKDREKPWLENKLDWMNE